MQSLQIKFTLLLLFITSITPPLCPFKRTHKNVHVHREPQSIQTLNTFPWNIESRNQDQITWTTTNRKLFFQKEYNRPIYTNILFYKSHISPPFLISKVNSFIHSFTHSTKIYGLLNKCMTPTNILTKWFMDKSQAC